MENTQNKKFRYQDLVVGWFVLSVWIAGGPRVVTFAYDTIKGGYESIKCEFVACSGAPLVRPSAELVEEWQKRVKAGKLPVMEDREFALLLAVKETNGL